MSIITTARDDPTKPATIMAGSGHVTNFADLLARAENLARLLLEQLSAGDRVALLCENEPGYIEAAWGARRAGLNYVPVNWHLTPTEARYIVNNSDARALIASASLGEIARSIADASEAVVLRLSVGGMIEGFKQIDAAADLNPRLPEGPDGQAMFYSSGTTGSPKGILRPMSDAPFGSPTVSEALLKTTFELDRNTVLLIPAPLYHAAPLSWSQAAQGLGGTVVLMERFDAEGMLAAIEAHRVTHVLCVPIHFIRLLRLPEAVRTQYDLSSLRHVVHGAAPCPREVKHAMIEWFGPVIDEFYSASEAAGFCTVTSAEWLQKPGTVGRSLGGGVRVVAEDGTLLPPGEPGLLYFEATPRFIYHNDPVKTEGFFDREGWGCNGDIGWVDEDGYVFLADRKSNMIISGGVNIYPQEVENLLITHPAVADVAVIGVPNAEYGEEVKAVIELRAGEVAADQLAQMLIDFCRSRLAGFKCPRSVDFIASLPRHENGKLLKREVRARYWPRSYLPPSGPGPSLITCLMAQPLVTPVLSGKSTELKVSDQREGLRMRYARLGNSGLIVSRMAFGTMTMGSGMSAALARLDSTESDRLIHQALDAGVNLFDTANVYHAGESERILGAALKGHRNDAVIATKVGMRMSKRLDESGLSARNINQSIEASLQRLDTDHVDLLLCHRADPTTPLEETLAALDRVVQAGKVRYIGFSNWPAWLAAKAVALQKANGWAPFIAGQMYYSLVGRDLEHEYVPFALDAGVGTMVWSPLAGGFLSGKYTREDPTGGGGRVNSFDIVPIDHDRGYTIVDVAREIAESRGVSVPAVALAWLADAPAVSTVIIGFANETQMKQNLEASDLVLTPEERERLDTVSATSQPYPQSFLARFNSDPSVAAVQ